MTASVRATAPSAALTAFVPFSEVQAATRQQLVAATGVV